MEKPAATARAIFQPQRLFAALLILLGLSGAASVQAGLGGYPVIHIHGFQAEQVADRAELKLLDNEALYQYVKNTKSLMGGNEQSATPVINYNISWNAAFNLQEEVAEHVFRQLVELQEQSVCDAGCIIMAVSAGDLITRYVLENQAIWFAQYNRDHGTNLQPLNVLATIDLVGAGGGTNLATLGVWAAQGEELAFLDQLGIRDMIGEQAGLGDSVTTSLGFVEDLTLAAARNVATDYASLGIPRFRVSAGKSTPLLSEVLYGADDGVIAAHSSCGLQAVAAIESCSNRVGYDGALGAFAGPGSGFLLTKPGLLPNYYPVIMSGNYAHSEAIHGVLGGKATFVRDDFSANGLRFDVDAEEAYGGWWIFHRKTHQWIAGSDQKSMVDVIIDAFGGATAPHPQP